jgi:hypothetical protein
MSLMKAVLLTLLLLVLFVHSVLAIDPGTAQGSFQVDGEGIQLNRSYVHLYDNVEGLLAQSTELRILFADREVSPAALAGIGLLAVEEMAMEGRLRGLLLRLDPEDRDDLQVTLLYPPAKPGQPLMTQSLIDTGKKVLKKLEVGKQRVTGEAEQSEQNATVAKGMPKLAYSLRFSAPLFKEPRVTADLKGKAALSSPQVQLLREKAKALAKHDYDALRQLSSEGAKQRMDALRAQAGTYYRVFVNEEASALEGSLHNVERVVVRGDRAVVIFSDKESARLVRQGKAWKSDD